MGLGVLLSGAVTGAWAQVGGFGGFGQASGAMMNVGGMNQTGDTRFAIRPWAMVNGTYSTILTPPEPGQPANNDIYGVIGAYGVGGSKVWQRTSLGITFSGMHRPSLGQQIRSLSMHTLSLGVSHLVGPRTRVSAAAFAGYGNGGMGFGAGSMGAGMMMPFGFGSMLQAGQSDFGNPLNNGVVDNDIFDVGTLFGGATGSLVHQLSQRWSVGAGGGTFIARRRYRGLNESQGYSGYGMTQYAVTRTTSLGVQYAEQHFSFRGLFGGNRAQSTSVFLRKSFSPSVAAGVAAGGFRFTSRFIGQVAIDPALQELLGGFAVGSFEVREVNRIGAMGTAFVSKSYRRGFTALAAGRGVTPGNGVLLAARSDNVSVTSNLSVPGGWALGGMAFYSRLTGLQQIGLKTQNYMVGGSVSRALGAGFWAGFSAGYRAVDFPNRPLLRSRFIGVGITWMPQDAVLVF